jgi:hypothetical protein
MDWLCGAVLIYGWLFGIGKIILQDYTEGALMFTVGTLAGAVIFWDLSRRGWKTIVE